MTTTSSPEVEVVVLEPHVGLMEIRRPPNNYFDTDLIRQLVEGVAQLVEQDCRAVVLCSDGKHFCAGAQLGQRRPEERSIYEVALELFAVEVPLIVAAQGASIGGGMGLALVGDFRVGVPTTSFRPNFARLGMNHGFGMTATLAAVVGENRAMQILERGANISAEEALSFGLLDEVVADEELRSAAAKIARELAANAPQAVRGIRKLMRRDLLVRVREAVESEGAMQGVLMRTNDFREGVSAASERRPPEFTNT